MSNQLLGAEDLATITVRRSTSGLEIRIGWPLSLWHRNCTTWMLDRSSWRGRTHIDSACHGA